MKFGKKIFLMSLMTVLLVFMFVTGSMAANEKLLIGFSHVAMNCPYYLAMEKAAKDTAEARGADIIIFNAEVDIAKQRNGPTGQFEMIFNLETGRFFDYYNIEEESKELDQWGLHI